MAIMRNMSSADMQEESLNTVQIVQEALDGYYDYIYLRMWPLILVVSFITIHIDRCATKF